MHFSKDNHVIAIDIPGFGESSHNRTTWSMKGFGDDVNAVVKGLDVDKVVLIGFSMGAPVVIEASKKTKNLAGVILVDDIRDLTAKFSDEMIEGMKGYINDLLKDPTQEKLVAGGFFTQNLEEATAKVQAFRATNYWQEGWDSIITSYLQWYNELGASSIQECPVPIAMINSDLQPMNLDYTRELVPSIHIDIVPGSGHVIMWDFPDKFNELVEANVRRFMNNN